MLMPFRCMASVRTLAETGKEGSRGTSINRMQWTIATQPGEICPILWSPQVGMADKQLLYLRNQPPLSSQIKVRELSSFIPDPGAL